jgi:hypothetical protein
MSCSTILWKTRWLYGHKNVNRVRQFLPIYTLRCTALGPRICTYILYTKSFLLLVKHNQWCPPPPWKQGDLTLCPFQRKNHITNFNEFLYENYATGSHPNLEKRFNFIKSVNDKTGNVRTTKHWGAFVRTLLWWKRNKYYLFWGCVCCLTNPVSNAPYCHLWPAWLYNISPHYLINGTIFGEKSY